MPSPQYQADIERIRQLKLQQFEEGLKAKTSVPLPQAPHRPLPAAAPSLGPPRHTDPIAGVMTAPGAGCKRPALAAARASGR